MRQTATLLVLLMLAGIAAAQPMSGTYTVKPDGSGNFLTVMAAGDAVRTRGVVGPVIIDIYSGIYQQTSYVNLSTVPGADSVPITFRAATGQDVTIQSTSYAFYGYNTNNIRIEGLRLVTNSYGIYMSGCDYWQVVRNVIRSSSYPIYFTYISGTPNNTCDYNLFERNDIRTTTSYAVFFSGTTTALHNNNRFINNLIYGWTSYGIYAYYNSNTAWYYNTVLGSGTYAYYAYYATGDTFVNNIFSAFYPMYRTTGSSNYPAASNYNCWFPHSGSTTPFYNPTYGWQTLAQWQTNSGGLDMNSFTTNPQTGGVNNPRLRTGSPCIDAGTPISGITLDVDGDTRPTGSGVDIGADEYTSVGAAMSGTYYIKRGTYSADTFPSFEIANGQLALRGQSGNVTFEVFAGTYNEQVWIETPTQAPYSLTYRARQVGGVKDDVIVSPGSQYGFYNNGVRRVSIRDFTITGFTSYGIYVNNNASVSPWRTTDTMTIAGNTISGPNGIYMWIANANSPGPSDDSIYNNIINATSSYGIYIYGSSSFYTNRFAIFNNIISGFTSYGMYLNYMRGAKVYFNTIVNFNTSASYGIYVANSQFGNGGDSLQIKGNVLLNNYTSTGAYAMYFSGGTIRPEAVSNNCLWVPNNSSGFVGYSGSHGGALTWTAWQTAGFDVGGLNSNPQVGGPLNPRLKTGSPCINAGPAGLGIAFDVDGDARPTGPATDIGADEYTSVGAPMSGVYTIKQAGGGDFRSFPEAFGAVQLRGFGGNVQFDVYDGTYTGIPGSSAAFNFEGIGNGPYWLTVRGYPGQTVNLPGTGYSYGIRLYNSKRIRLENLRIYGASSYGIYATSASSATNTTDTCVVRGNVITAPYPIYWYYGKDDSIIGNTLNASSSYGLFVYGTSAPYGLRNVIANNMISGWTSYGIYLYYQDYAELYNNTVSSASSSNYTVYGQYVTNLKMKNNIFWNRTGSYAVAFWNSSFAGLGASDYNDLFAASMVGVWNGMGLADLASWRSSTLQDSNSISANPQLVSGTDLHLTSTSPCKDVGTVVPGFAYDIDGDLRPIGSAADIGADEFFVDLGVTAILAPAGGVPVNAPITPQVVLRHFGGPAGSNWVKMVITRGGTPVYTDSVLRATIPGDSVVVSLPVWTPTVTGSNYAVMAWHKQMPDAVPGNDSLGQTFGVGNVDVGITALLAPTTSVPQGSPLAPSLTVRNYGDFPASFDVRFRIDDGTFDNDEASPTRKGFSALVFDVTRTVTGLAVDAETTFTFDTTWLAEPNAAYTGVAKVTQTYDTDPSNDSIVRAFNVNRMDVGVAEITAPLGSFPRGGAQYPGVKVMNYGQAQAVCGVRFIIRDPSSNVVYDETQGGITVAQGDSAMFNLTAAWYPATAGAHTLQASTVMDWDYDLTNDTAFGACTVLDSGAVPTAWEPKASMPITPSGKMQKDGSWLVYNQSTELIYAAKGNKTGDFYSYDPNADAWAELTSWPLGVENKGPSKGSIACTDGNGTIYATKGNNTTGFWKYSDSGWAQLADVPLGLSNKKVKGGTDMVYVAGDSGYVYLLKGYKAEFYRFNVTSGQWQTLTDAPTGVKAKWDKGSWLAYDEANQRIIAHKAKYHEMFAYDLTSGTWGAQMPGMPLQNQQTGKSKKSKDGASAAFLNDGMLYALKGGNTCEFYAVDLNGPTWFEKDTINQLGPLGKKKRVKGGGDITSTGDFLYAFKGNKSNELWKYTPMFASAIQPARSGVMAERVVPQGFDTRLGPNPLSTGYATLRYSLPASGPATIKVVDVTGRTVLDRSLAAGRSGSVSLDLRSLSAGVYLVKFASGDLTSSHKLVIR